MTGAQLTIHSAEATASTACPIIPRRDIKEIPHSDSQSCPPTATYSRARRRGMIELDRPYWPSKAVQSGACGNSCVTLLRYDTNRVGNRGSKSPTRFKEVRLSATRPHPTRCDVEEWRIGVYLYKTRRECLLSFVFLHSRSLTVGARSLPPPGCLFFRSGLAPPCMSFLCGY